MEEYKLCLNVCYIQIMVVKIKQFGGKAFGNINEEILFILPSKFKSEKKKLA